MDKFAKNAGRQPNLATIFDKKDEAKHSGEPILAQAIGKVVTSDAQNRAVQAMAAGTPVLTLDGELPVEYLQPGDRVLTRAGARRVKQVQVTLVQNARVIRIAHSTLGVDRPLHDVTVSAAQQILIRDWRAKAVFGTTTAMIDAARLADGEYIRAETVAEARFFTLSFEEDAVIYAGGLELVCHAVTVDA